MTKVVFMITMTRTRRRPRRRRAAARLRTWKSRGRRHVGATFFMHGRVCVRCGRRSGAMTTTLCVRNEKLSFLARRCLESAIHGLSFEGNTENWTQEKRFFVHGRLRIRCGRRSGDTRTRLRQSNAKLNFLARRCVKSSSHCLNFEKNTENCTQGKRFLCTAGFVPVVAEGAKLR